MTDLTTLEVGVGCCTLLWAAGMVVRLMQRTGRRNRRLERFVRHEVSKGDLGEQTLSMLDETDPE
jgi:hypothetical protein